MAGPPLTYRLAFSEPWGHLVDVEATIEAPDDQVELWMPVWTPGSYLVREFSRHIQDLRAQDQAGRALPWTKVKKNRWRVESKGASRVTVRYRVYGRELSVRTNWIEGDLAFLNGAATFLTVAGREALPHQVTVDLPRGWLGVWTALDPADPPGAEPAGARTPDGAPGNLLPRTFVAGDFDTLVDSPLFCGTPATYAFPVDGVPITLLNAGESGLWDGAKAAQDVEAMVREASRLYGGLPFPRYLFLNLILESRGGLEHKNCCVTLTSRFTYRRRKAYRDWLGLMSHELFHAWNVKRSRPEALGPFDYENEAYTRSLWVAEGITNYYTDLIPRRTGLTTDAEYLEELSDLVAKTQGTPGRLRQSLEDASYDAWIKFYRPDENSVNTSISYYVKGGVVAWLLDAEIREATGGARSLDDLMRVLFTRYSGERGYPDAEVQTRAEEIAGRPLFAFFDRFVRGKDELDYAPALRLFGLRFRPARDGLGPDTPPVWLGLETKASEGRLLVGAVLDDGPARAGGLAAEDEILAVAGFRVTPSTFTERLHQLVPGERVELLISRRDAVRIVPVTPAEHPGSPWRLEVDPEASPDAKGNRDRWLNGTSG